MAARTGRPPVAPARSQASLPRRTLEAVSQPLYEVLDVNVHTIVFGTFLRARFSASFIGINTNICTLTVFMVSIEGLFRCGLVIGKAVSLK